MGLLLSLPICARGGAGPPAKNVLILFSSVAGSPHFEELVEPAIRERVPGPISFYIAHLVDTSVFDVTEEYLESQAETFRRTYAGVKMDLVIAVSPPAFRFAERHRDRIFPGVPIVFTQLGTTEFEGKRWPGTTGLTVPIGIAETIDLALRSHPGTQTVAVVSGPDTFWLAITQAAILRRGLKATYFIGPASPEVLAKIGALPPHTVVLFHIMPDASHPMFGGWELLAGVTKLWPTYSAWPQNCLDHGCIGGAYPDLDREHLATAAIAARVLSGERPEDIPIAQDTDLQVRVDWRQLQRWHISASALPPGSLVLYREPTFWERYRRYAIAAMVVIAAQALLIAGLLWQRARKQKAEMVLRESEERFRKLADTTPSLIWMCDTRGKIIYLNDRRLAFTGPDLDAGYGDTWIRYVHPDDVPGMLSVVAQAMKTHQAFSKEYRLLRRDGVYRWIFDVATPRVNGDGSFAGLIGSAIDITDQKLAQEALEKVSGQLIEAQERERSRIARDLHDDICQRLALLSMELDRANADSERSPAALGEIRKHCIEIAHDVQSLSHQLHSAKLDYLGIVVALRGFCGEFSKQHSVRTEFRNMDVPERVPRDIALCLFRVAQEALHNAVKYSRTNEFTVELRGSADELLLEIRDGGVGFNVEEARRSRGLGMVSMRERVHLVHGRFSIESRPGEGTKVIAAVPLVADAGESREKSEMGEETPSNTGIG